MVTESNFTGTDLLGKALPGAATQSRAEAAVGAVFGNFFCDNAVGVFSSNVAFNVEVLRQYLGREARLFLTQINRHKFELYRRVVAQIHENIQHPIGILAARQTHHDAIAGFNHVVVSNRFAGITAQALLQLIKISSFIFFESFHSVELGEP